MKKIILYCLIVFANTSIAQIANYDFFAFRLNNMFNVNPAWVTKDEGINVVLNGQTLSPGVRYANKNLMFGVYSEVGNKSGLGFKIVSDSRGAFQVLRSDISYGFHAKFSEAHSLRFGALAGVHNSSLNTSKIENYSLIDPSDPTLSNSYFNTTQFVAGAGLLYSIKGLDVSLSLPQIISTSKPLNSYINAAAFYKVKAGEKFTVQPWLSYQSLPVSKNLTGFYVKGTYLDLLWAQIGYQSNRSFAGVLGVTFDNIGISYGFRASNSEFRQVAGSIHEVGFTIRINRKSQKEKSIPENSNSLDTVIKRLNDLLGQEVTMDNKSLLRAELDSIKQMLRSAEIDNSDPKKAKKVEGQLRDIEEKLSILEKKLFNE